MRLDNITRLITPSLVRYLTVGVLSLVVDYVIFITLYYVFHAGTAVAAPAGLMIGLVVNFLLNKAWSFGDKDFTAPKQLMRQIVLYGLLVAFNSVVTYFLIESLKRVGIEPKFSKLMATAVITLWNYVLYQKVIFRTKG